MLDTISMAQTLKDEYREAFEKADLYSTFGGANPKSVESKLMDLYQKLHEAQQNEIPIEEVIGSDMEIYCKEYFKADKKITLHKGFWDRAYNFLKWIFIFTVADLVLMEEGENIITAQSNMAPFLYGIAIGLGIELFASHFLKPLIFKNSKMKPIHYYLFIIVFFVVALILTMVLLGDALLAVSSFPLLVVSGSYVIAYLLLRSIWRYKKYGRITAIGKEEKKLKKHFNDVISEKTLLKSISEIMMKRFDKINRKRTKRGETELTMDEFAAFIHKEIKQRRIFDVVFAILITVMILAPTINIMINDGLFDGLLFGAFMSAVGIATCMFFFKADKTNEKVEMKILKECEEQNITISKYVEKGYEDGTFL